MAWSLTAVRLPDGAGPVDLWVSDDGRLVEEPVVGAEPLPGRFVLPGLVDAHAHPAIGEGEAGPVARSVEETAEVLAGWLTSGVTHVRDTGSPAGVTLDVERRPGLPTVLAAGRFLAPEGRYFPALLPEPVPPERLTEVALAELSRGARWVKVIGDFPAVVDGVPAGEIATTYPPEVVGPMIDAVHAAGGRVAVHCTTPDVADLVRAGVDSIEHGVAMDEAALELMAGTGAAWTPTLSAVLSMLDGAPAELRAILADFRDRLQTLLPLAVRLGVPVLAGTDTVGTVVDEVAALAANGLDPAQAIASASTAALDFLAVESGLATLVTYDADPRDDVAVLEAPAALVVEGVRVR